MIPVRICALTTREARLPAPMQCRRRHDLIDEDAVEQRASLALAETDGRLFRGLGECVGSRQGHHGRSRQRCAKQSGRQKSCGANLPAADVRASAASRADCSGPLPPIAAPVANDERADDVT
jgi:hypothetical protein